MEERWRSGGGAVEEERWRSGGGAVEELGEERWRSWGSGGSGHKHVHEFCNERASRSRAKTGSNASRIPAAEIAAGGDLWYQD